MGRKIVLFELNEVPFRILDTHCQLHASRSFARNISACHRYETFTEDVGHLSPWVTWPTLHRGVKNEVHRITDFGQDTAELDDEYAPIWKLLARAGVSTGIGGSLHSYPMPHELDGYAFYLPDTFAAGSECFPALLSDFQEFNLAMARDSARNISDRVPWASALQLLRSVPQLGFHPRTAVDIGRQLISERIRSERKVRRRTYQSVLAFDVVFEQLARTRPSFATFFTNHVASSMHRYWAAAFPGDYAEMRYDDAWLRMYGGEIRFAMSKTEQFLQRLFAFADRNPEYVVWIVSSMGQAATNARPLETQLYAVETGKLMHALGFAPGQWEARPAMLPQFNVSVAAERQGELLEGLDALVIQGRSVSYRNPSPGFVSMDFGHENLEPEERATFRGTPISLSELGLENVEIQDKSGSSAYHIPEGCLLVYDPRDKRHKERAATPLTTLDIAPSILDNFGVPVPGYMNRPVRQLQM